MSRADDLTSREVLDGLDDRQALQAIGELVDLAQDSNTPELTGKALRWADDLERRGISDEHHARLDYFRANAFADRYRARLGDGAAVWAWDQPELQQQIFLLRRARYSVAFADLPWIDRCQILTNLANVLDTVGRFIEARAIYSEALAIEPEFWMARGNRGVAAIHYARALFDRGHQRVFALRAHGDLLATLASIDRHGEWGDAEHLFPYFAERAATIGRNGDLEAMAARYDPANFPLGRSKDERAYRAWGLRNRLFLNPLNDVEDQAIAAHDILNLPSFTTGLDEPPSVIGFFNQLKQEYASARWLYYSGTHTQRPHFSDRAVFLHNTLDYPSYGLAVEQVKLAFRMAYSLFDKIAFFLNQYLKLGIPERQVSFRSIWRSSANGPIRDVFEQSENWPLRGLYWLGKDFFEPEMRESTDPDARVLSAVRNHLEHKYLKVHELSAPEPPTTPGTDPFYDDLAYSISRQNLEQSTLKLLKLARAALIYLSLGMHREERRREEACGEAGLSTPMSLGEYQDSWKR
jgi:hypothetical protein